MKRLTTLFVAFALVLLMVADAFAQSTGNYTFSYSNTGSLVDMSTGTTDLLATGTYYDDVASAVTNIGFTFTMMGVNYTQFSVNSNGQLRLGSTVISGTAASPAVGISLIAPMGGDNAILAGGRVRYKVIGSSPTQQLVVEWDSLRIPYATTITASLVQAILSESGGIIEFRYGYIYNNTASTARTIFFSSSNLINTVGSVAVGATPTYSTAASPTSNTFAAVGEVPNLSSTSDGSRWVYTFTPPSGTPSAPTSINFTNITSTGMTVGWTDNSTNETFFGVFRSTDNVAFTLVGSVASTTSGGTGSTYSLAQTGLASGTTYYFRVTSGNEGGGPSGFLTGNQATNDSAAPVISYTPLLNTGSTAARTLTATITDPSGVPRSGIGLPVLYWRINAGAYLPATAASLGSNQYQFGFGSGVVTGDTVRYYVCAQDSAATPNVGCVPSAGASGFTANPPAAATPPTTPSVYLITASALSGDYTVGTLMFNRITGKNIYFQKVVHKVMKEVDVLIPVNDGRSEKGNKARGISSETSEQFTSTIREIREVEETTWMPMETGMAYTGDLFVKKADHPEINFPDGVDGVYATITAAVADLNLRGVGGAVRFLLNDPSYTVGETYPITIAIANEFLPTATNTITIKPNTGVTSVITCATAQNVFGIYDKYVTIDGSNTVSGTTRDLSIVNTYTGSNNIVVILWNNGVKGATDVTVKNCLIEGTPTTTNSFGLFLNAAGGRYHNTSLINNKIQNVKVGIQFAGLSGSETKNGLISGNVIGDAVKPVKIVGILCSHVDSLTVAGNEIFGQAAGNTFSSQYGIYLGAGSRNSKVRKNQIHDFYYTGTGGYGCFGILFESDPFSVTEISNNFIYNIASDGDAGGLDFTPAGIYFGNGGNVRLYFNSVYLSGNTLGRGTTYDGRSACVSVAYGITLLDMRDNIFQNSMGSYPGSTRTNTTYGVYSESPNTAFTSINYNDYFVNGVNPYVGYLGGNQATLAAWQTATAKDANSISADPKYQGTTNLHINTSVVSPADSAATPIAGLTTDIDNNTRDAVKPDMGADEFTYIPPVLPPNPAVIVSPLDAATGVPITASLNWASGGGGPTGYRIYFGTDNPPTNIENGTDLGLVTTYDPTPDMTYESTYYWKIVPYNSSGDATGTVVWSFSTQVRVSVFPYSQDFEGATDEGWTTAIVGGSANNWVRGTPSKTQIAAAHGGTNAWVTKLTGSYDPNHNAAVISPPFNFSSLTNPPTLDFWHNFKTEAGYDGCVVEYTTNGGATWRRVDSTLGTGGTFNTTVSTGWYNRSTTESGQAIVPPFFSNTSTGYTGHASGWIHSTSLLVGLNGQSSVQIRWRHGSDGSVEDEGWALDDVLINPYANDVTANSVDDPASGASKKINIAFSPKATFTNVGGVGQTSVPVRLKIFDGTSALVYTDNQTITSLPLASSQQVTFGSFTPTTTGTFTARAIALNPGDENGTNDSTSITFSVVNVPQFLVRVDSLVKTVTGGSRDSTLFYMRNDGGLLGDFSARAIVYPLGTEPGKPSGPVSIPMEVVRVEPSVKRPDVSFGAARTEGSQLVVRSHGFTDDIGYGDNPLVVYDTLHYDGPNVTAIGTGEAITFDVAARFTPTELSTYYGVRQIKTVMLWVAEAYTSCVVKVWQGGSLGNPGTVVYSQAISPILGVWTGHELSTPVPLLEGNEYWIGYEITVTTGFPAGCDGGPHVLNKSQWILFGGTWYNLVELNADLTFNWNLRMVLEPSANPWLAVTPTSGSVAISDSVLMKAYFDARDSSVYNHPGSFFGRIQVTATNSPVADTLKIPVRMFVQPLPAPLIVAQPDSLNFGTVYIGADKTMSFLVQNIGGATAHVTNITITDPNFNASPTSFTLASMDTQRVNVTFNSPFPAAQYTGTLSFVSDASSAQPVKLVGTSLGVAVISLTPSDSLKREMQPNSTATDTVVIKNIGTGPLNWAITDETEVPVMMVPGKLQYNVAGPALPKGVVNPGSSGPITDGQGGPDAFGYSWIDSDAPGGPTFSWVDISLTGTKIDSSSAWVPTGTFAGYDEGYYPIGLPSSFSFYGVSKDSLFIGSNGTIMFQRPTGNIYTNAAFPTAGGPIDNHIGVWWIDMEINGFGARVFYGLSEGNFVVQYQNVPLYGGIAADYTFEVILKPTGEIRCQYLSMAFGGGSLTSSSIGIENATGTVGLGVVYNAAYMHNNLALKFSLPDAPWLAEDPPAGTVQPGDSAKVVVTYNTTGLVDSTYLGALKIASNDTTTLDNITGTKKIHVKLKVKSTLAVSFPVLQDWSLISVPVLNPSSYKLDSLFHHIHAGAPYAYAFSNTAGYIDTTILATGPGYWLKDSLNYTESITGVQLTSMTFTVDSVTPSWNIIGSISTSIPIDSAHITLSRPDLLVAPLSSAFIGYPYSPLPTSIDPGKGYWVKVAHAGTITFHTTGPVAKASEPVAKKGRTIEDLHTITIRDAKGATQTLYFGADPAGEIPVSWYAMPPYPPVGAFDARFVSADGGTRVQTHAAVLKNAVEMPIAIQSVAYPLTVSWKVTGTSARYTLSDGTGTHKVEGEGTLTIRNSDVRRIVLKVVTGGELPKEFALSQNYPNPFNPTTKIEYALPVDSRLTMEIYNILGQCVRTLVNGNEVAGYHSIEWNGTGNSDQQVASGVYFCRLVARPAEGGSPFVNLRKMLLLK